MFEEPETWVAIAFILLMGLFGYLGVHRTVLKALDNRSARIKAELDDARRLKEEAAKVLEEYKARHKSVWPEMQQALRETGWHNYSLFLTDDGLLIGYLETPDFQKALSGMASKEVNKRWQDEMAGFFISAGGKHADKQMASIPEVFHLD